MSRVVRRSIRQAMGREPLRAGNTEGPRDWLDPEHPIRGAWAHHASRPADIAARISDPAYRHVTVVHLRNPRPARSWLSGLPAVSRG